MGKFAICLFQQPEISNSRPSELNRPNVTMSLSIADVKKRCYDAINTTDKHVHIPVSVSTLLAISSYVSQLIFASCRSFLAQDSQLLATPKIMEDKLHVGS